MSQEDFEVLVDGRYDNKVSAKVVTQLDLTSLAKTLAPSPEDPDVEFSKDDASRPEIAPRTEGPHRYTVYVPHDDKARINVGEAHPVEGETGITLETLSHIHMYTFGESISYLSLGDAPARTGSEVNQSTQGYSLYTNGWSKHLGEKQISFTSQTEGISLLAAKDVSIFSQGDNVEMRAGNSIFGMADGDIELSAGKEKDFEYNFWGVLGGVALVALDGADFVAPHVAKDSQFIKNQKALKNCNKTAGYCDKDFKTSSKETYEHWVSQYGQTTGKWLEHGKTVMTLGLALKKKWKATKSGKTGWETAMSWWEMGLHVMEWSTEITSIFADIQELSAPKPGAEASGGKGSGQIKLKAKKSVSIAADKSVSIYGANGATLSGFKSATVSGSLSATLSSLKSSTVFGGLGVTVQALAGDLGLSSDLSGASLKAKKKVQVASETEEVNVTAEKDVQLNSNKAKAFVHGAEGAYLGAGKGDGWGVVAKPSEVKIGSFSKADDFKGVTGDSSKATMTMSKSGILMKKGDSNKIYMTSSAIQINTPKFDIKATGKTTINGAQIHIG